MPSWRSASPISPGSRACPSAKPLDLFGFPMYNPSSARAAWLRRNVDPLQDTETRDIRNTVSMEIIDVQWRSYRLPFLHNFSTAHSVMTAREGIIVQVRTSQGISGLGEIAPLPAFTGESLAHTHTLLPSLAARLRHKTLHEALDFVHSQEQTKAAPTLCGLEIALLDALGKAEGCAVSTLLSPLASTPRAAVPVNAVIGARATTSAVAAARDAKKNVFRCIKINVGLGMSEQDVIERVASVSDATVT